MKIKEYKAIDHACSDELTQRINQETGDGWDLFSVVPKLNGNYIIIVFRYLSEEL